MATERRKKDGRGSAEGKSAVRGTDILPQKGQVDSGNSDACPPSAPWLKSAYLETWQLSLPAPSPAESRSSHPREPTLIPIFLNPNWNHPFQETASQEGVVAAG